MNETAKEKHAGPGGEPETFETILGKPTQQTGPAGRLRNYFLAIYDYVY